MKLYRVAPKKFCEDKIGIGAFLKGGRWNRPGVHVLYTAESPSLAILEALAYYDTVSSPPVLVMVTIEVPDDISIDMPAVADLPADWDEIPRSTTAVAYGTAWLAAGASSCLRVPSVLTPVDYGWNFVLNPFHPELVGKITITHLESWDLDRRLTHKRI
jgi:RES domain-containing protein